MEERAFDPRSESASEFDLGEKFFGKPGEQNQLFSIKKYKAALFNLKCIKKAEFMSQDAERVPVVLSALIKAINALLLSKPSFATLFEELKKFLILYIECYKRFNENAKIMPGLGGIDRRALKDCFSPKFSQTQKDCLNILRVTLWLFHSEKSRRDYPLPSKEKVVVGTYELYKGALKIAPVPVPKPVISESLPPSPVISSGAAEPAEKKIKVEGKPEVNREPEESEMILGRVFDPWEPDPPKRIAIAHLISQGNYELALRAYPRITNRNDEDFRGQGQCQEVLGRSRDARNSYLQIQNRTDEDRRNIERLDALIGARSYSLAQSLPRAVLPGDPDFQPESPASPDSSLASSY